VVFLPSVSMLLEHAPGLGGHRSKPFNRQREHVADAAQGPNDMRRSRTGLQFAAQAQYPDVDAPIENILTHVGCPKEIFTCKRPQGRIEKGSQKGILTFCQPDRRSLRINQSTSRPFELPAVEFISSPLRAGWPRRAFVPLPPQHGSDARGQFPDAIRFCEVVVRAEFEPQHSIDFIAPQTARDNDGNIGPRPDHQQKLEAFVGRPKIEHDKAGIAGEFFADILALVSQGNINAVPLQ
jgi:hypothetical protein